MYESDDDVDYKEDTIKKLDGVTIWIGKWWREIYPKGIETTNDIIRVLMDAKKMQEKLDDIAEEFQYMSTPPYFRSPECEPLKEILSITQGDLNRVHEKIRDLDSQVRFVEDPFFGWIDFLKMPCVHPALKDVLQAFVESITDINVPYGEERRKFLKDLHNSKVYRNIHECIRFQTRAPFIYAVQHFGGPDAVLDIVQRNFSMWAINMVIDYQLCYDKCEFLESCIIRMIKSKNINAFKELSLHGDFPTTIMIHGVKIIFEILYFNAYEFMKILCDLFDPNVLLNLIYENSAHAQYLCGDYKSDYIAYPILSLLVSKEFTALDDIKESHPILYKILNE